MSFRSALPDAGTVHAAELASGRTVAAEKLAVRRQRTVTVTLHLNRARALSSPRPRSRSPWWSRSHRPAAAQGRSRAAGSSYPSRPPPRSTSVSRTLTDGMALGGPLVAAERHQAKAAAREYRRPHDPHREPSMTPTESTPDATTGFDLKHRSRALTDGPSAPPPAPTSRGSATTTRRSPSRSSRSPTRGSRRCRATSTSARSRAKVKDGIRAAGGTPMELNTIAISDGITMGTPGHARVAGQPGGDRRLDRARLSTPTCSTR